MRDSSIRLVAITAMLAAASACGSDAPVAAGVAQLHSHSVTEPVSLSADELQDVARLRAFTAPFHQFETAVDAGWNAQITECFSDPELGGMGFHYGNPAYIDGAVDVLEPELLLYEPQKNGKLRLVAVEYIVPFDAWTGSEPPQLFGQSFGPNEAFGIWALHVWHERNNPEGLFASWNPKVTCDYAP